MPTGRVIGPPRPVNGSQAGGNVSAKRPHEFWAMVRRVLRKCTRLAAVFLGFSGGGLRNQVLGGDDILSWKLFFRLRYRVSMGRWMGRVVRVIGECWTCFSGA